MSKNRKDGGISVVFFMMIQLKYIGVLKHVAKSEFGLHYVRVFHSFEEFAVRGEYEYTVLTTYHQTPKRSPKRWSLFLYQKRSAYGKTIERRQGADCTVGNVAYYPSRTAVYETERGLTEERYHDKIEAMLRSMYRLRLDIGGEAVI